jgi:hypothetical protein
MSVNAILCMCILFILFLMVPILYYITCIVLCVVYFVTSSFNCNSCNTYVYSLFVSHMYYLVIACISIYIVFIYNKYILCSSLLYCSVLCVNSVPWYIKRCVTFYIHIMYVCHHYINILCIFISQLSYSLSYLSYPIVAYIVIVYSYCCIS